jgi:hypothetical protein
MSSDEANHRQRSSTHEHRDDKREIFQDGHDGHPAPQTNAL